MGSTGSALANKVKPFLAPRRHNDELFRERSNKSFITNGTKDDPAQLITKGEREGASMKNAGPLFSASFTRNAERFSDVSK